MRALKNQIMKEVEKMRLKLLQVMSEVTFGEDSKMRDGMRSPLG